MTFADSYKKRMELLGKSRKERAFIRKSREFEQYFEDTLTKGDCVIDGVVTQAVFQDQSQSNSKGLSDDKYIVLPNDVKIGVGSYVEWRDKDWIVFTDEAKTIPDHQQLKIKPTNYRIKWLVDKNKKTICNGGKGWSAYVQNNTLYTLGVSFSTSYMPLANAKMSVYIKDVPEVHRLKVGSRIFIGGNVFKIEFIDYVSRVGLVNWLLDQDTKNDEMDNSELEVADYYDNDDKRTSTSEPNSNTSSEKTSEAGSNTSTPSGGSNSPVEDDKSKIDWLIEGETKARIGRSYVYTAKSSTGKDVSVSEWIVGDIEGQPFYVLEKTDHSISIRIKDDYSLIGTTTTIAAKVNDEIKNIAIKIIKKFG